MEKHPAQQSSCQHRIFGVLENMSTISSTHFMPSFRQPTDSLHPLLAFDLDDLIARRNRRVLLTYFPGNPPNADYLESRSKFQPSYFLDSG
jgi:hypothetical protein